jgi:hypothetical protein
LSAWLTTRSPLPDGGYFDDPDTAEPLRWLETCDEQVKDCMIALESMMDPKLDELIATAMEEHQRGETAPLDSLNEPQYSVSPSSTAAKYLSRCDVPTRDHLPEKSKKSSVFYGHRFSKSPTRMV